jgi:RNA polymerase sigma-70 factor, ECF subfamily
MANAELLFALHRQGVFRYLTRVVGRAETAQDLTQEVFLRVSRAEVPVADASGHRAWVFKIARNLVLNHIRDGQRRGQALELVETDASAPATQEMGLAIRQALDALADVDRDVFLLRESAGLNYEEIAATCDLTVEAVRGRLRRAREELRAALDGELTSSRRGLVSIRGAGKHGGEGQ